MIEPRGWGCCGGTAAHPENPTDMDQLMAAIGAEVRDWSYTTSYRGGAPAFQRHAAPGWTP